jgi:hypothetical protein
MVPRTETVFLIVPVNGTLVRKDGSKSQNKLLLQHTHSLLNDCKSFEGQTVIHAWIEESSCLENLSKERQWFMDEE